MPEEKSHSRQRIFISYKRNFYPDEAIALKLFEAMREEHDIFIDQLMLVGTAWAEKIDAEIQRSDYLITLLSAESVQSEMVVTEISKASQWAKTQGHPKVLPVRLAYREPFDYRLSAFLDALNWTLWEGEQDTNRLISELKHAISGNELAVGPELKSKLLNIVERDQSAPHVPPPLFSAQPLPLEQPSGTMSAQSTFYIERDSDKIALSEIQQQGVTITIKGPRQVGKSSLLERTIDIARRGQKSVVFLDFQQVDSDVLKDADRFYPQFCYWIWREARLKAEINDYATVRLGNVQRCTYYIQDLLEAIDKPLVLAMDEVERLLTSEFRSDFFGMLRSWHNARRPHSLWENLDLVLVTSTEPYLLIDNKDQSPFNVGEVIELEDFTRADVTTLNRRHQSPFNPQEEENLVRLIGAHPYLLRKAMFLVASGRSTVPDLFSRATDDNGPFGDHLRTLLFHLYDKEELVKGLIKIIAQNQCSDDRIFFRLKGAGLVRREGNRVVPRCKLYADFFRERLHG